MTEKLRLELPRSDAAPRLARERVAAWAGADLDGRELADAKLLVSELVTNALVHGDGRIALGAQVDENRLLVEVIDEGVGFEHVVRERDFDQVGGRGLNVVDAVASRWGIHDGSSHVWFELERRGPHLAASLRDPG